MNAICDKGSTVITSRYGFAAGLEPDEEGRLVVHFVDWPEALSDGAPRRQCSTDVGGAALLRAGSSTRKF
jgi:hypothetical protein